MKKSGLITTNSKRVALESLQSAFERVYAASDTLDGKLQNVLNYSSIMISIAGTVFASNLIDKVGVIFWFMLIISLILYFLTLREVLRGLKPVHFPFPISENLETIKSQYYESAEDDAIEQAVVDHLHYMKHTMNNINTPKSKSLVFSSRVMAIMAVFLVLAVPLGLLLPVPNFPCFFHLPSC
jgi:ATP-dependent Zn protease